MAKLGALKLTGASGQTYDFEVYDLNDDFNAVGAVYTITHRARNEDGGYSHTVIYIGETSDLSTRFDDHHKKTVLPSTTPIASASTLMMTRTLAVQRRRTLLPNTIRPATTSSR